ncbi:hypothetical protein EHI8A_095610 [Entamoeba histolytica HM-1:IMSS-B]|uniref:Uncharacterized protein n=1 Tax=Entamoeba histolytica HM-1:IMSS-B TaxID=885319 RepID=M3UZ66_ENTH1|nr:hypothetical protein EHI8A_095610 [Entamoeba histolytica HM-1:IMSS-B]
MSRLFTKTKKKPLFFNKQTPIEYNKQENDIEKVKLHDSSNGFNPFDTMKEEGFDTSDTMRWFDKMTTDSGEVLLKNESTSVKSFNSITSFQFSPEEEGEKVTNKMNEDIQPKVFPEPRNERIISEQLQESKKNENQVIETKEIKRTDNPIKQEPDKEINKPNEHPQVKPKVNKKSNFHISMKKFEFKKPNLMSKPLKDRMKDSIKQINEKSIHKSSDNHNFQLRINPNDNSSIRNQTTKDIELEKELRKESEEGFKKEANIKKIIDFPDNMQTMKNSNNKANINQKELQEHIVIKQEEKKEICSLKRRTETNQENEIIPPPKRPITNKENKNNLSKFEIPTLKLPIMFNSTDNRLECLKRISTVIQMLNYAPIKKELQTSKVIFLPEIHSIPKPTTEEEMKASLLFCKQRIEKLGNEIECLLPITCCVAEKVLEQLKEIHESRKNKLAIIKKQEEEMKTLQETLHANRTIK